MSSINGVNPLAYSEAIQCLIHIAEMVSKAIESAKAYNFDIVKTINKQEKRLIDLNHTTHEVEMKIHESGIEPFLHSVGNLIDSFLPKDQFTYSREYLSRKEILESLERYPMITEIQYYADPGIYEKRSYKFLLDVFQTADLVNQISALVGDPQYLEMNYPALHDVFETSNFFIRAHDHLCEVLRMKKDPCVDKELSDGLKRFDQAYFSLINLERKSFSSKALIKELARLPFNVKDNQVGPLVKILSDSGGPIEASLELLTPLKREKYIAAMKNMTSLYTLEVAKETGNHSEEKVKRVFGHIPKTTNGSPPPTFLSDSIKEMQGEIFLTVFQESLKNMPSSNEKKSYQFILESLSSTIPSISLHLPLKAVEEREYWIMQYIVATTLLNLSYHHVDKLKIIENRLMETIFGLSKDEKTSFLQALSRLTDKEKKYLHSKIQSMRPDFIDDSEEYKDLEMKSQIDSLYSTLIGASTNFLKHLCKDDESVLPKIFTELEKVIAEQEKERKTI